MKPMKRAEWYAQQAEQELAYAGKMDTHPDNRAIAAAKAQTYAVLALVAATGRGVTIDR